MNDSGRQTVSVCLCQLLVYRQVALHVTLCRDVETVARLLQASCQSVSAIMLSLHCMTAVYICSQ